MKKLIFFLLVIFQLVIRNVTSQTSVQSENILPSDMPVQKPTGQLPLFGSNFFTDIKNIEVPK